MNCYRESKLCCYFHPNEVIVGICSICLRERLLILASKDTDNSFRILRRKHSISLSKVFSLGSFLQRLESRHHREDDKSDEGSLESFEDSFISIKFEENGIASWVKKKSTCIKPSSDAATTTGRKGKKEMRSVVQRTRSREQSCLGGEEGLVSCSRWRDGRGPARLRVAMLDWVLRWTEEELRE